MLPMPLCGRTLLFRMSSVFLTSKLLLLQISAVNVELVTHSGDGKSFILKSCVPRSPQVASRRATTMCLLYLEQLQRSALPS